MAAAARHPLCVYLNQLAVLVHALIAQEHPSVVTEVGCLLVGITARIVPGMGYTSLVHSVLTLSVGRVPGSVTSRGAISLSDYPILAHFHLIFNP
jgi:hypothetical protein